MLIKITQHDAKGSLVPRIVACTVGEVIAEPNDDFEFKVQLKTGEKNSRSFLHNGYYVC